MMSHRKESFGNNGSTKKNGSCAGQNCNSIMQKNLVVVTTNSFPIKSIQEKLEKEANNSLVKQKQNPVVVFDSAPPIIYKGPKKRVLIKKKQLTQFLEQPFFYRTKESLFYNESLLTTQKNHTTDATPSHSILQFLMHVRAATPLQSTPEMIIQLKRDKKPNESNVVEKFKVNDDDEYSENQVINRKKRAAFAPVGQISLRHDTGKPTKKLRYQNHNNYGEYAGFVQQDEIDFDEVEYGQPKIFSKRTKNHMHVVPSSTLPREKKPNKITGATHYRGYSSNDDGTYKDKILDLEISYPDIKHQSHKSHKGKTKFTDETLDDYVIPRLRIHPPKISHEQNYLQDSYDSRYATNVHNKISSQDTQDNPKTPYTNTIVDTDIHHEDMYHPETYNPYNYNPSKPNSRRNYKHHFEKHYPSRHHLEKHHKLGLKHQNDNKNGEKHQNNNKNSEMHHHNIYNGKKHQGHKSYPKHNEHKHRQKINSYENHHEKQFFIESDPDRRPPVTEHSDRYRTHSYTVTSEDDQLDSRGPDTDLPDTQHSTDRPVIQHLDTISLDTQTPVIREMSDVDHLGTRQPDSDQKEMPHRVNIKFSDTDQPHTRYPDPRYQKMGRPDDMDSSDTDPLYTQHPGSRFQERWRPDFMDNLDTDRPDSHFDSYNRYNERGRTHESKYYTDGSTGSYERTYADELTQNYAKTHKSNKFTSKYPSTKNSAGNALKKFKFLVTKYHTSTSNTPTYSPTYQTIITTKKPQGFGEPPDDDMYLDSKMDPIPQSFSTTTKKTVTPNEKLRTDYNISEVRIVDENLFDYVEGAADDPSEDSNSIRFEYVYQDDATKDNFNIRNANASVLKDTMPAIKHSDSILVGGQNAEPPAQILSRRQVSRDFSSALVSSYVNYKNSNMAFSPQNLNDAFSVMK